jgi:hypothetical protein
MKELAEPSPKSRNYRQICLIVEQFTQVSRHMHTPSGPLPFAIAWLIVIALMATSSAQAKTSDLFPTECVGPESSTDNLIFLHAILTEDEIKGPLPYRQDLESIANELRIRIAMPRSTSLCKTGDKRYCWGTEEPKSVEQVYSKILKSSSKCFKDPKLFLLAGFSNGGYHATRAALLCLAPQPLQVLAFGSAGNPALLTQASRKACAPIFLAIGNRDISVSKARSFAQTVKRAGEKIEFQEFTGGHVLPVDLLRTRLKKLLDR